MRTGRRTRPEVERFTLAEVRERAEARLRPRQPAESPPRRLTGGAGTGPRPEVDQGEVLDLTHLERTRRTRTGERRKARRGATLRVIAGALSGVLAATGVFLFLRNRGVGRGPETVIAIPSSSTLAWSVTVHSSVFVTVVGVPAHGLTPVAVVIPGRTAVDLPGGGAPTVGQGAGQAETLVAAVQATLGRPVGTYLLTSEGELAALVDALGGAQVDVQTPFALGDRVLGPGPARLSGPAVVLYLSLASPDDAVGRWEDVADGLFTAAGNRDPWLGALGTSGDRGQAARLLGLARGAEVLELPTAASSASGLAVDKPAADALMAARFGVPSTHLVRVVVLNGNGRPGMGALIGSELATSGFRVVAAQNASSFDIRQTEVVASRDSFLPAAREAAKLLGVGKVYVGSQPTGIADITIVVGRDFRSG